MSQKRFRSGERQDGSSFHYPLGSPVGNEYVGKELEVQKIPSAIRKSVSTKEAKEVGDKLNLTWKDFSIEQFRKGMIVELEHGNKDSQTNVTNDNLLQTGKIALAHLKESPDYYNRLAEMEESFESVDEGEKADLKMWGMDKEKEEEDNPIRIWSEGEDVKEDV